MCSVSVGVGIFGSVVYRNFCVIVGFFFFRVYVVGIVFVYCNGNRIGVVFFLVWFVDCKFIIVVVFFYSVFVWVF